MIYQANIMSFCCGKLEKSVRHVPMVAKFPDDKKSKIHLKSEFAPASIKVENNGAEVYVESSLTTHNPLFSVHNL